MCFIINFGINLSNSLICILNVILFLLPLFPFQNNVSCHKWIGTKCVRINQCARFEYDSLVAVARKSQHRPFLAVKLSAHSWQISVVNRHIYQHTVSNQCQIGTYANYVQQLTCFQLAIICICWIQLHFNKGVAILCLPLHPIANLHRNWHIYSPRRLFYFNSSQ